MKDEENEKEMETKEKQSMSMKKKWVTLVSMAVVFGLIAGGVMYGVNAAGNRLYAQSHIANTDTLSDADEVSSDSTDNGSASVEEVTKDAMPSLVTISTMSVEEMRNFFGGTQKYEVEGAGTGVIVGENDSELLIATNNHVVDGAQTLSVGFIDETAAKAQVKGTDAEHDIAVISVNLSDLSADTLSQIKVIQVGSSADLQVGEQVVAIGNALGYGQSVTTGIVSALNRPVTIDGVTNTLIQTDAAINPGNSGGALLNMSGQLVGINSAKYSDTTVEGMGYAIPVDDVTDIIESLMNRTARTQKAPEGQQGFLGITGQDVTSEISEAYGMPKGVYITSVEEGSAAEKAGLQKGDIITKFDGTSVSSLSGLQELISYYSSGETVEITYSAVSDGQYTEQTAEVTLGVNENAENIVTVPGR